MSKTLTLQLDDETYRLFDEAAKAEERSLDSFIKTSVLARIRQERTVEASLEPTDLQRAIDEAEDGIARGHWIRHSEVEAKLRHWAAGET